MVYYAQGEREWALLEGEILGMIDNDGRMKEYYYYYTYISNMDRKETVIVLCVNNLLVLLFKYLNN